MHGSPMDPEAVRSTIERALARMCPRELAGERDDIVQTALARILEIESSRGPGTVRAASYLWQTAFSVIANELRRRRRRPVTLVSDLTEIDRADPVTPETLAARRETARSLRDCIAALARPRQIAVMLHLQGHGRTEGAALVRWDVKRFENLVYRGLADLRMCLEAKGVSA